MISFASEGSGLSPAGETHKLHAFYPSYISYSGAWEKYIDQLDSVSFAWSRLDGDDPGTLNAAKGQNNNTAFYFPDDYILPVQYAKSKGKSIQISIFSEGSDAVRILTSPENRSKAVNTCVNALDYISGSGECIHFDGVVIDFEGLQDKDSTGRDILFEQQPISFYFNSFLKELKTKLEPLGKKLYVAVNPRLYYDGYDYSAILKTADKVIMMVHDYEPTGSLKKSETLQYTDCKVLYPVYSPAPINKVRQALMDMRNSVSSSTDMQKVWLQIAFDCAQWKYAAGNPGAWEALDSTTPSLGGRNTPTYQMIKNRIDNLDGNGTNLANGYNNELQSPYIQYFNTADKTFNIILYEDRTSVEVKLNMAKSFGVGGVSLWSLGNIPDFTDPSAKSFHLDVWNGVLAIMGNWDVPSLKKPMKINFSSKKVESAVRSKTGKLAGDILDTDIAGIYRLRLPADTDSLKDLKLFTNLEYLEMQQTAIKDLTPISGLTKLRTLLLPRNQISDIRPLKKLTKLEILSLNGNKISDVSALSGLTRLKELYLNGNSIGSVTPLAGLTAIEALYLDKNRVKDIRTFSKLRNLKVLSLENNLIRDVKPLAGLIKLERLYLPGNKLSSVDGLKGLTTLQTLHLQHNLISDILGLHGLTKLVALYLGGNPISDYSPVKNYYGGLTERDFSF